MSSSENPLAARNLPPPIEPMRRRERLNPFAWVAWLLLLAALCMALWWAYVTGHLDRLQAFLQSAGTAAPQEAAAAQDAPPDALPEPQSASDEAPPATTPVAPSNPVTAAQSASGTSIAPSAAGSSPMPAASAPVPAAPATPPSIERDPRTARRIADARNARAEARPPRATRTPPVSTNRDVQVLSRMPPRYPAAALQSGATGSTVLQVEVSRYGAPTSSRIVQRSGSPALDRAAMAAVAKWRFLPAMRDGQPVAGSIEVAIELPAGH